MSYIDYIEHPALRKARKQSKNKMSITQTFVLAHKARSKLSREASRPDHDLRHLVLTANLLDSLMLHLSHAEQDAEVTIGREQAEVNKSYLQNVTTIEITYSEEDGGDSDDDASSDDASSDEEDGFYSLQRTPSRAPSLVNDLGDSDDDESNPPSPRQTFSVPVFTENERQSYVYDDSLEDPSISYLEKSAQMQRSANLITAF